jgi:transcriptional regulator with XRE-family HTH domain
MNWAGIDTSRVLVGIGAEVKRRRQALGLTQVKLAKKARIHYNVIGRLERGTYNPTVAVLCWIAAALDTPVSELLRRRAKTG